MSNKYLEKIAEQTEYRGPSNWQTAGLVGAGILGTGAAAAGLLLRSRNILDKHGLGHLEINEVRKHLRDSQIHPEVRRMLDSFDTHTAMSAIPAAVGMASVPAVALHRQYQDYKSGNKDPHYGRGALLGSIAGTTALGTPFGAITGAAAGLGAVGLNHLHNKWSNHE